MALDGKLLGRARLRLEALRRDNEAQHARRILEVYARCPRVRSLDQEIRGSVIDVIGAALGSGSDPEEAVAAIREKNLSLQAERALALSAAGFPGDYLDNEYLCDTCRDTGYVGTELCSCLKNLYREEQRASLSNLFKLGSETFDNFDLSWYDDKPDPGSGVSPDTAWNLSMTPASTTPHVFPGGRQTSFCPAERAWERPSCRPASPASWRTRVIPSSMTRQALFLPDSRRKNSIKAAI